MGSRTVLLMMAAYHQDMIMHQHGRLEMIFLKHMIVGTKLIWKLVGPNNLLPKTPEAHHQHTCMTSGRTHPRMAHAMRTPGSFEGSYRRGVRPAQQTDSHQQPSDQAHQIPPPPAPHEVARRP